MLDLFKGEVETQSKIMHEHIEQLSTTDDLVTVYEKLINSSRALKGAIKLVHVDIATPLVESLEGIFSHLQSQSIIADRLCIDLFNQAIDLLNGISSMPAVELNNPDMELINKKNNILTLEAVHNLVCQNARIYRFSL